MTKTPVSFTKMLSWNQNDLKLIEILEAQLVREWLTISRTMLKTLIIGNTDPYDYVEECRRDARETFDKKLNKGDSLRGFVWYYTQKDNSPPIHHTPPGGDEAKITGILTGKSRDRGYEWEAYKDKLEQDCHYAGKLLRSFFDMRYFGDQKRVCDKPENRYRQPTGQDEDSQTQVEGISAPPETGTEEIAICREDREELAKEIEEMKPENMPEVLEALEHDPAIRETINEERLIRIAVEADAALLMGQKGKSDTVSSALIASIVHHSTPLPKQIWEALPEVLTLHLMRWEAKRREELGKEIGYTGRVEMDAVPYLLDTMLNYLKQWDGVSRLGRRVCEILGPAIALLINRMIKGSYLLENPAFRESSQTVQGLSPKTMQQMTEWEQHGDNRFRLLNLNREIVSDLLPDAGTPRRRFESIHWNILQETRLFLRYVLEASQQQYKFKWPLYADWKRGCGIPDISATNYWDVVARAINAKDLYVLGQHIDLVCWKLLAQEENTPYQQWMAACLALTCDRQAIDQARSRSEQAEELVEFYVCINHQSPRDENIVNASCRPTRDQTDNDMTADEFAEFSVHVQECSACFWALSDYENDRLAWGFRPDRERNVLQNIWHKFKGFGVLFESISSWDQVAQHLSGIPPFVRKKTVVNAHKGNDRFLGFGLNRGSVIEEVHVLDANGKPRGLTRSISVLEVDCDEETRDASITVSTEDLPETVTLLLMRAQTSGVPYTVSGELHDGIATLRLIGFPEEFGNLEIEAWFALEVPIEP